MTRCAECDYDVELGSPRYHTSLRDHLREQGFFVRLRPWSELDPETKAIFESAQLAAEEVAKWPSWKLGRCNCPVVAGGAA